MDQKKQSVHGAAEEKTLLQKDGSVEAEYLAQIERDVIFQLLRRINSSNGIHELMKIITQFLKNWSGCDAVGIRLREGNDFPYFETRGFLEEFVQAENLLCAQDAQGNPLMDDLGNPVLECMCGNVLCGRFDPSKPFFTATGSFWTNSTTELLASTTKADRLAHTRNRCNTAGFESLALIPVRFNGETLGLLQLNDRRKGRFTPRLISLLEYLSNSLAIGLAQKRTEQALLESEDKFRYIFDHSVIGKSLLFPSGKMQANKAFCEMLGYSQEEFSHLTWQEITHPEDRAESQRWMDSFFSGKIDKARFTKRYIHKNGSVVWVDLSKYLRRDPSGKPLYFITTVSDITEQKRMEQALRESEEQYRSLFANMLEGYAYCRMIFEDGRPLDFIYLDVNNAFESLTGLKDAVGKRVSELIPGIQESSPDLLKIYSRVALTGRPERFECYVDSLGRWFSVAVYCPRKEHFIAIFDNITERKQADTALRKSEAKYRTLFTEMLEGFATHEIICDQTGKPIDYRFLEMNPAFERLTGLKARDCLGKTVLEIVPGIEPFWIEKYGMVALTGVPTQFENYSSQLQRYYLVNTFCPQKGQFTTIFNDITERKLTEESLKEGEARFRAIFDDSALGIALVEKGGRVVASNPALQTMLGYSAVELSGLTFVDFTHPEDVEADRKLGSELLAGERENYRLDKRYIRKDGQIVWGRLTASLIRDSQGQPKFALGMVEDITERKRVEDSLRESEERFRRLSEANIIGIITTDETKILSANDTFLRMIGYSREELEAGARDWQKMTPPEFTSRDQNAMAQVLQNGWCEPYEKEFVRNDGSRVPILIGVSLLRPEPPTAICFVLDLTKRKQAEESLKESEALFRAVFEESAIGIALVEKGGRIAATNPAMQRMLGYSAVELSGLTFEVLTHPEDVKTYRKLIRELLAGEREHYRLDKRYLQKDDGIMWGRVTGSLIRDSQGQPKYALDMVEDIMEQKKAEDKIRRHQERLRSLASRLSVGEEQERRRIAVHLHDHIGQTLFLAKLKVGEMTTLASTSPFQDSLREIMDLIEKAIHESRFLTHELASPILYELGLEAALRELVMEHQKKYGLSGDFLDDGKPKPLKEEIQVMLYHAVRELLHNVVKHAQAVMVKVTVQKDGNDIQITVEDNGVGFSSPQTKGQPTALEKNFGLFNIRERLADVGGSCTIESKPGLGTRILLRAPLKIQGKPTVGGKHGH